MICFERSLFGVNVTPYLEIVPSALVCFQIAGQFADGRRQFGGHDLRRYARAEQVENNGWAKEVHRSGQSWGGEDRRPEELGGHRGGQVQVQQEDLSERTRPGRSGWADASRRWCAPSPTPPMWEPADEGHRWWTKIGTQFVQPSTKGVEEAEWENLCYKLAVMNKEVYVRKVSGRSKAKTLWKIRDAKKEVTRIVTNPTRRKLSVGRMSTKSRGVYSLRARPLPCQKRLRKVETWEDAEWSAGKERKLISCVFLLARWAGGWHQAVRASFLVCWAVSTAWRCEQIWSVGLLPFASCAAFFLVFSWSDPQFRGVFAVCFWGRGMGLQTRRVLPVRDGSAPVMFLTHCHHAFLFSTALQGDSLFLPARQRSTGWDHAAGLKNHVETHSTSQLGGQVPSQWLEDHSLVICPACSHPTCNNLVSTFKERLPPDVDEVLTTRVPLRTHIPKAAQESSPTTTHGAGQPFLSVHPKSWCSVGNEGENKNSKRSFKWPMTAVRAMAWRVQRFPVAKATCTIQTQTWPRPPVIRLCWRRWRPLEEGRTSYGTDKEEPFAFGTHRLARWTSSRFSSAVAQEMQDRHPALGAEDQARMMLLPVSLVSIATLPAISPVQNGRVSAHNTSKGSSSIGTETNLCGPLWPGQHLPGPHPMPHRLLHHQCLARGTGKERRQTPPGGSGIYFETVTKDMIHHLHPTQLWFGRACSPVWWRMYDWHNDRGDTKFGRQ